MILIIGFFLALLVGVTLGLVGSGGSILTVPILITFFGITPQTSFIYSLFIVGVTAVFGTIRGIIEKNVEFRIALSFGITSIITVYLTRILIVPYLPQVLIEFQNYKLTKDIYLLLLFAVIMLMASISMIRTNNTLVEKYEIWLLKNKKVIFVFAGICVGIITGLVGAGGGFLIVPVLFLIGKLPMNRSVSTSLMIISMNSIVGFLSNFQIGLNVEWKFLITFTSFTVSGIIAGIYLSKKINGQKLKKGFGWFVLVLGIFIIISSLFH